MSSRKRVLEACRHRDPDRVPVDFWARRDVSEALIARLGLADVEELYKALGIDLRQIGVEEYHDSFEVRTTGILGGSSESSGRRFIICADGRYEDAWGVVRRLGSDQRYEQWISGPFKDDTNLDSFPWPATDIYEGEDALRRKVQSFRGEYALLGTLNLPFKIAWHLRGLENFLCDMVADPGFSAELLRRVASYEREKGLRLVRSGVDIVGIYGDIALQDRLLVEPRSWRRLEKPILAELLADFKSANPEVLLFYHSDGDISELLPDLIEIGFEIINPIQPECMDPAEIKRKYGQRITLHGTISIQRTLPRGSTEDVRREVRERVRSCGQGGGLIICPSNMIQPDTPLENILALYEAATDRRIAAVRAQ